jgi:hypothetical protein
MLEAMAAFEVFGAGVGAFAQGHGFAPSRNVVPIGVLT